MVFLIEGDVAVSLAKCCRERRCSRGEEGVREERS